MTLTLLCIFAHRENNASTHELHRYQREHKNIMHDVYDLNWFSLYLGDFKILISDTCFGRLPEKKSQI